MGLGELIVWHIHAACPLPRDLADVVAGYAALTDADRLTHLLARGPQICAHGFMFLARQNGGCFEIMPGGPRNLWYSLSEFAERLKFWNSFSDYRPLEYADLYRRMMAL